MDSSSAPVQPPVSEPIDKTLLNMVLMDVYTGVSAVLLFVTFLVVVTRFRLWHSNFFLKKIPELANNPVYSMIMQALGFVALLQDKINDLYLIWVVILIIAYDNVCTISSYSLLERAADRRSRECGSLYNSIYAIVILFIYRKGNEFHHQLLVLMFLVLAKFLIQIVSYMFADRAYGLENSNLVAEYMKNEHKLTHPSDATDPASMKGYKYLVMGEEKIDSQIKAPYYSQEVDLKDDGIVTVERVWGCNKGLLHPSIDKNGGMKDVCLSFALFKLLRRRKFRYPAAEAQQPKTKQLIFNGLLSEKDKDRVFRVIKTELGFLRDLTFTRYPVGFAFGFPVWNLVLLVRMLGVTLWFAIEVFNVYNRNTVNSYLFVNNHEIDKPLTYMLLIIIILMELFEVFTYVFCDWAKVTMICRNVTRNSSLVTNQQVSSDANSHEAQPWLFGHKVLALFCKPRYFLSIKNNLGQYSLLENCGKNYLYSSGRWYSLISTCEGSKINAPPPGLKKGKSVKLSLDVKEAIFDTLAQSRGDCTNGKAALQRNRAIVFEELKWTLNLETPVHTIMVWHVATSLCAIPLVNVGGNKDIKVATDLSNYCAYLVAFHPDLLPLTSNSVKYMFKEIFGETHKFFGGVRRMDKKHSMLMNSKDGDQKIIHRGSKLAHSLTEKVRDDAQRWKLMADFWSELILYIAPSGSIRAHIEQLSNGSEFITHLWALLYHAGIIDTNNEEYHP
ncbi:uncharacterized protein LOC144546140 [Carex rostrata]